MPIELVQANGKKHLTKAEIEERLRTEVKPIPDGDMTAPAYLTPTQKKRFDKIAGQLEKLRVMSETDVETLARYVAVQELFEAATKRLRVLMKRFDDPYEIDQVAKLQDRYFKQAQAAASSLGLTIASRCRLVVPGAKEEEKPVNKFAQFARGDDAG